jgi:hypothetical protein
MAGQTAQTYANHTRWDPAYHFFVVPVAGINVVVTIWNLIKSPSLAAGWFVILAIAAVVALLKLRVYPLKAQDRIIRLEERLRLGQLLAGPLRSRIGDLTEGQLVGLRFASDGDVPALVEKALGSGMSQKEIKQAVASWRADYFRV